ARIDATSGGGAWERIAFCSSPWSWTNSSARRTGERARKESRISATTPVLTAPRILEADRSGAGAVGGVAGAVSCTFSFSFTTELYPRRGRIGKANRKTVGIFRKNSTLERRPRDA